MEAETQASLNTEHWEQKATAEGFAHRGSECEAKGTATASCRIGAEVNGDCDWQKYCACPHDCSLVWQNESVMSA